LDPVAARTAFELSGQVTKVNLLARNNVLRALRVAFPGLGRGGFANARKIIRVCLLENFLGASDFPRING
jgi:hypothetical protein